LNRFSGGHELGTLLFILVLSPLGVVVNKIQLHREPDRNNTGSKTCRLVEV